ncbi:hypothetical protein HMPREF1981_00332 [Bacteroides pyogenes F0041]|uniref:Uncharacterized protein n=1 Tax=Bacteroides pyogenes F0041 TaxID=1321819 RepID=U2CW47_9BACE|nr:hypothetical protein HMPREF1981_00332 [Bacteroides pyogenes F0041]
MQSRFPRSVVFHAEKFGDNFFFNVFLQRDFFKSSKNNFNLIRKRKMKKNNNRCHCLYGSCRTSLCGARGRASGFAGVNRRFHNSNLVVLVKLHCVFPRVKFRPYSLTGHAVFRYAVRRLYASAGG